MTFHPLKFLVFCLVFCPSFGQTQKEMYNQSVQAYQNKDYNKFLELTQRLDSVRPSHPTYTYNLACAFALNGKTDKSISVLEKCLLMNSKIDFETETDLASLKNSDKYKSLAELKLKLETPIATSNKVISLSEKTLHPEGLLYLNKSKIWLAASIRNRKIVSFDIKTGQCTDWFTDKDLGAVFALKADKKENILWVSTASMPEMKGYNKNAAAKAEVLKIDILTKTILKRFPLQGNHVFGDLVLAKNGEVYISDSGEATIFKITNDEMSVWLDLKKEALNLQGLAFNEDESQLFIADYMKGILKISMQNPSNRNWLKFPKETTVKGIDGLVWYKNTLLAIHNGVKPIRIIQYALNQNDEISGFKILDHNRPEFDEPALGTISNGKLYFFSNSPWKAYGRDFNLDETKFENPTLFETSISNVASSLNSDEIIQASLNAVGDSSVLKNLNNLISFADCKSPKGKYTTENHTDSSGYSYFKQVFSYSNESYEAIIHHKTEGFQLQDESKLDNEMIAIIRGHEFLNIILEIKTRFHDFEKPTMITIGNDNFYQIKAKTESGIAVLFLFNVKTHVLNAMHFSNPSNPKDIIKTKFSNWKQTQNVQLPFHIEIEQGGNQYIFDYQKVLFNSSEFTYKNKK